MTSKMISQRLGSTDSASPQGRRPDTIYGQIAGAHYGAVAIVRGCCVVRRRRAVCSDGIYNIRYDLGDYHGPC